MDILEYKILDTIDVVSSTLDDVLGSSELHEYIIELNTIDQLYNQGIDSNGILLTTIGGDYSPFTVEYKKNIGQPIDRITLFNIGEYYNSYSVVLVEDGFILDHDPMKNGHNLTDRWGEDIIGLTEDNMERLSNRIMNDFLNLLSQRI